MSPEEKRIIVYGGLFIVGIVLYGVANFIETKRFIKRQKTLIDQENQEFAMDVFDMTTDDAARLIDDEEFWAIVNREK